MHKVALFLLKNCKYRPVLGFAPDTLTSGSCPQTPH